MKLLEKSKVVAYCFYIFAALFLIYTVFSIISTISYLNSVVASGMYVTITASDMISAFVGQVGPYCFYTLVLFGIGYLVQVFGDYVKAQVEEEPVVSAPVETEEETEEAPASEESEEDQDDRDDDKVEEEIEQELAEEILKDDPDQVVILSELEEVPVEDEEDEKSEDK